MKSTYFSEFGRHKSHSTPFSRAIQYETLFHGPPPHITNRKLKTNVMLRKESTHVFAFLVITSGGVMDRSHEK